MQPRRKPSRTFSQSSIHGRIAHEIGQQILRGDLEPGETLPSESDLGAGLGVSRTVLREAIKVLAAKGLVESRTKIGTRVKARDEWNLLDPDVLSWSLASHDAESYALAVSEMRRVLEPAGAALAAQRATPDRCPDIGAAIHVALERAVAEDDPTPLVPDRHDQVAEDRAVGQHRRFRPARSAQADFLHSLAADAAEFRDRHGVCLP